MLIISVKNGFLLMSGNIGNVFCTATCLKNIWSTCGEEFGAIFGADVVIKRALYGLNAAYNSFHKFFVGFLRDLGFNPYRSDQDLCLSK